MNKTRCRFWDDVFRCGFCALEIPYSNQMNSGTGRTWQNMPTKLITAANNYGSSSAVETRDTAPIFPHKQT